MRIWKLISGIVSIVLAAFVIFQSSAAGLYNAMSGNNESGGTAGLFTALPDTGFPDLFAGRAGFPLTFLLAGSFGLLYHCLPSAISFIPQ